MIRGIKITCVDGRIGEITFSITGPTDMVDAILQYIGNLSRMRSGLVNHSQKGIR